MIKKEKFKCTECGSTLEWVSSSIIRPQRYKERFSDYIFALSNMYPYSFACTNKSCTLCVPDEMM